MSFPAGGRPAMVRIVPDNSGHFLHPWRSHGRAGGGKIPAVSPSTASKESLTAHRIPANSASAKPLSTPQSFRPRRQQACVSHRPCGSESDAGTYTTPGEKPSTWACASYACSNAVVAIMAPGRPRRSRSNMSCRLHDVQEPQSARASTTTSHSSAMVCPTSGAAGLAEVSLA